MLFSRSKKKILMIATGGTIASKPTGSGLAPALTSEELLECVPEIAEFCSVETVQPFNLDSTDVYFPHWLKIASIVEEHYRAFDGFVVTHGTDTMAYTAAALSYLIEGSRKPVVLTGSQKSAYLRDTDARRNLVDAFRFCADDGAYGVRIVFDGNVILGTRARKTRTRSYNAFTSVDFPSVAVMRDGEPFYYLRGEKPRGMPVFLHALNERIFVLKMTPGLDPAIFSYLEDRCDGLILETFGSGGLPNYKEDAYFEAVKRFAAAGRLVVIATQVEREGSALASYAVGRRLLGCENVIEARCMTLEAAYAKLSAALAGGRSGKAAEQFFRTPVEYDIF